MAAMNPSQQYRMMGVASPLGDDVLLLRHMVGTEQLSQLFNYRLDVLSTDDKIDFTKILGENMTVRLELKDSGTSRYFNGFVSEFSQGLSYGRYASYQVTLKPWLWFLTRTADCRIFQDQTVPDIVKQVFRDHGFSDFEEQLSNPYRSWEYCVQYRESDFNFISRLLEQEGIYYYFKHENGKHTLVLADSQSAHSTFADYAEIPFYPPLSSQGRRDDEHIFDLTISQHVQPSTFALNDFDFKVPGKNLNQTTSLPREHAQSHYEVYDYPGEYVQNHDGEQYTRIRIEELQCQYEILRGQGNARGLSCGYLFALTQAPRADYDGKQWLVVSARHELRSNEFDSHP